MIRVALPVPCFRPPAKSSTGPGPGPFQSFAGPALFSRESSAEGIHARDQLVPASSGVPRPGPLFKTLQASPANGFDHVTGLDIDRFAGTGISTLCAKRCMEEALRIRRCKSRSECSCGTIARVPASVGVANRGVLSPALLLLLLEGRR